MKKYIAFFLALVCLTGLMCTFSGLASAESDNYIRSGRDEQPSNGYGSPGPEDVRQFDRDGKIVMPSMSSYLDSYTMLFVDAPKGHSVYVYNQPKISGSSKMPFAYHGVRVHALAVQDGFICGIYPTEDNELAVGWISESNLSYSFPGEEYTLGMAKPGAAYVSYFAQVEWSKEPFVGRKTKYTKIVGHDGPTDMVDAIAFEYQVTSRQGRDDASGPRDVYINGGNGWVYVGTYDLEKYSNPVRINIYFDEPVTIKAVATIPQDEDLDGILFRQFVTDMMFIK